MAYFCMLVCGRVVVTAWGNGRVRVDAKRRDRSGVYVLAVTLVSGGWRVMGLYFSFFVWLRGRVVATSNWVCYIFDD